MLHLHISETGSRTIHATNLLGAGSSPTQKPASTHFLDLGDNVQPTPIYCIVISFSAMNYEQFALFARDGLPFQYTAFSSLAKMKLHSTIKGTAMVGGEGKEKEPPCK